MVGTLWKLANAINEGFSIIPHSKPTAPHQKPVVKHLPAHHCKEQQLALTEEKISELYMVMVPIF